MNLILKPGQAELIRESLEKAVAELEQSFGTSMADIIRGRLETLASVYDDCSSMVLWARVEIESEPGRVIPLFPDIESRRMFPNLPVNLLATLKEEMWCYANTVPARADNLLFDMANRVGDCKVGIFRKRADAENPLTQLDPCAN